MCRFFETSLVDKYVDKLVETGREIEITGADISSIICFLKKYSFNNSQLKFLLE